MRIFVTLLTVLVTAGIAVLTWMHFATDYKGLFFSEKVELREQNPFGFNILEQGKLEKLDRVRQVDIISSEGIHAHFNYNKNTLWTATKPWADRAYNIGPIVAFTNATIVKEVIPVADAKPEIFGFGKDSHRITLKDEAGEILADFYIGDTSAIRAPLNDKDKTLPTIYLRDATKGDDAPTLLCTDPQLQIRTLFKNGLVGLRDYRPAFISDKAKVNTIKIKQNGSTIEMHREIPPLYVQDKENLRTKWVINKPLELRANQEAANKLLNTIHFITANNLKQPSEVTLPENDPNKIEIELGYFKREKKILLSIYPSTKKNNLTLAKISDRPNVVFEIPELPIKSNPITYTSLPKNVNDLRARNMLALDLRYIDTVTFKKAKKSPIRLTKLKDWYYIDPKNQKVLANQKSLDEFFLSLYDNNIDSFVTDAPNDLTQYGLKNPPLQIFLVDKYNNPQIINIGKAVEYQVGKDKRLGYYAKSSAKDSVWIIKSSALHSMRTNEWEWLPLEVLDVGIASLRQIKLERRNKPNQFIIFDIHNNRLEITEGDKPVAKDNPIISHLVDSQRAYAKIGHIVALKGIRRLDPASAEASVALLKPLMTLHITYEDPFSLQQKRKQLTIAASGKLKTSRFFYLKDSTNEAIYQLDRPTVINLFQSIRYQQ